MLPPTSAARVLGEVAATAPRARAARNIQL
jgi:hypothetical protein